MDANFILIRRMKRGDEAAFDQFVSIMPSWWYNQDIGLTKGSARKR